MRQKSETFACFKQFYKLAERHTGFKISKVNVINRTSPPPEKAKTLRTDNGSEYLSNEFKNYQQNNWIQHQITVAYTPNRTGLSNEWIGQSWILFVLRFIRLDFPKNSGVKQLRLLFASEIEYHLALCHQEKLPTIVEWENLRTFPTFFYMVANAGL